MTTATMTMIRGGWGKAIYFPIAAIVIGLGGGFAVGRAIRTPPPSEDAVEPLVVPKTRPMATGLAAKIAEQEREAARQADKPPVAAPIANTAAPSANPAAPSIAAKPPTAAPTPAPAPTNLPKPVVAKAKAHIRSTPDGAAVSRASDGEPLGTTPFDLELPESDKPLGLLFWKQGFAAREDKIVPRGEVTLNVTLASSALPRPKKKIGGGKKISNSTTIDPFN